MTAGPRHVVLGAGPVGRATAGSLADRGLRPFLVSRSDIEALPAGVQHCRGDVLDPAFLAEVIDEGAVVYQALGLPYHQWSGKFPALQEAVVSRCVEADARLVSFENVYMYGMPTDEPFREDAPHRPCSVKGRIRADMAQALGRLREARRLDVCQVRASDLFGPGVYNSALGDEVFGRIARGLAPRAIGNLDAPHTWTFIEDCGLALAAAGTHPCPPPVVHVPSEPAVSVRHVVEVAAKLLDKPLHLQRTPIWVLRLLGWFNPVIAELPELLYEFDRPFVVSDDIAREIVGVGSTPLEAAVAQTLSSLSAASVEA